MPAISIDGASITYRIRHSRRARHGRIQVGPDGVEVVVPTGVSEDRVKQLVYSRRRWIRARHAEFEQRWEHARRFCHRPLQSGAKLLYAGEPVTLHVEPDAAHRRRTDRVRLKEQSLYVRVDSDGSDSLDKRVAQAVESWMRSRLRQRVEPMVHDYAQSIRVAPAGLRIKTQRRRWGSCGSTGLINLNWRLAMAPDDVVAYVVVHELCHLVHRNHSRAFWCLVADHCPAYRSYKQWLAEHDLILTESVQPS
ncbi:MAG TPA: SprT family zinc-dependent metalloprotease [Gammaproteobacteria bacterium]|nr:SprT family zinc-dependent metalloprotease [Gammaproteobacteria bacterium]